MNKDCTVYKTASFVGKRWTLSILLELYKGKTKQKRYSEIKRRLPGITAKILSSRLKELQKEGLINKKVDSSKFPIKSEYSLTKSGREFIDILKDMKSWALRNKFKNKLCSSHDCKYCKF